jgi:hypothetical protein
MLLEKAKEELFDNLEEGVECPCCGQFAKIYHRPMHRTMALMLIRLYELDAKEHGYHHASEIVHQITDTGTNDLSKLRYWDFIEEMPKGQQNKRTSGFWAITDKGRAFALNRSTVASHIKIYNKQFLGFEGDPVSIVDVLGKDFDYKG